MVKTYLPLLLDNHLMMAKIAKFWDTISEAWQRVWGIHIHHGFYEDNQTLSPLAAQEQLILKLTEFLTFPKAATILDVGCGMGGSSLYLAEKFNAQVTGITLSPKQVQIANHEARRRHISHVHFTVENAMSMQSIKDNSIDIVWSLESCEQFFDKALFLEQAYRVLKPGGQLMLATWCSSQDEYKNKTANQYKRLCAAFDVPYMPTIAYYQHLLRAQHFTLQQTHDWTCNVQQSWDIGIDLVSAYSLWQIIKMAGLRGLLFSRQIKLMRDAYQQQMLKYGVFIAVK